MKKIYKKILFMILIAVAGNINAQNSWFLQYLNQTQELYAVYAFDSNSVWAGGTGGTIIHTSNGGNNWIPQNSGINSDVNSLYFINNLTGFAACTGKILKTTNGGNSWSVKADSLSHVFDDIYSIGNNCWSAGYKGNAAIIIASTDGGNSWVNEQVFTSAAELTALYFVNSSIGFAVGGNDTSCVIIRTTNGGLSWASQSDTISPFLNSVYFTNSSTGFVAGVEVIGKTTDAGNTWNFQHLLRNGNGCLTFVNPDTGYASDDLGSYLKTTNGGNNWFLQDSIPGSYYSTAISFGTQSRGWVATSLEGVGLIYCTTNGGNPIGIQQISNTVPDGFMLKQNYPNPFNPATIIKFDIAQSYRVKIVICDLIGREVDIVADENLKVGSYSYVWNASNFASGVYFCVIKAGDFTISKKMVLLK